MKKLSFLTAPALLVLMTANAHAYLDPGTGSIVLQAIVAGVASSLFVIRMYWQKLLTVMGMRTEQDNQSKDQH
jgi:hypothetical protein